MRSLVHFSVLFLLLLVCSWVTQPAIPAHADSVDELKAQIDEINRQRAEIDKEIAGYQKQLNEIGAQKQTLQTAIQTLDVSRSQTQAQISSIQKKIAAANLRLSELGLQISDKETLIALDREALAESLRKLQAASDSTLIEQLLAAEDIADAWTAADQLSALNEALHTHAAALGEAKVALAGQQEAVSATKTDLSKSNADLQSQKQALDINRQGKQQLLSQTQSQESAYQSLIAQKQAQRQLFEQEVSSLEEQINIAIDPTRIPTASGGVLSYPVDNPVITQGFGLTSFARSGAYGYDSNGNPKPHTGIDFGVPVGTPVRAPLSGTVRGWGNTDAISGCYSYGKWILIDHANGLSTSYLHLSSINVTKGQSVSTGDVIGYSGNTGYSTGPHLHFNVYAQQGVQMMNLGTWYSQSGQSTGTACARGGAIIPVAPKEAYLNPANYL